VKKIGWGIGIVAGLAGIAWFTPLRDYLTAAGLVEWVESVRSDPPWSAPWVFIAVYTASAVIAPLTVFPIAGGVLFGFWKGFLYNTIAANLGAWLAFAIARGFGRDAVGRLLKGRLLIFDRRVTERGFWTIFAIRMAGFPPFLVVNYAAGLSGIRVKDYILGTFFGLLVWKAVLTYFADTLWEALATAGMAGFQRAAARFVFPVAAGLLAVGLAALATAFVKKKIAAKALLRELHRK
jgi:phospholipase D1/2